MNVFPVLILTDCEQAPLRASNRNTPGYAGGYLFLGENVGLGSLFFVQMKIEDVNVIP
jgi:hypothetical protein